MQPRVKIYFDGGYRPAPTGMETAVVIKGRSYIERGLGPGSAMEAEWRALIRAVELAQQLGIRDPLFLGDALAVIHQAHGIAKPNHKAAALFQHLYTLLPAPAARTIRYIKRNQNLAGIALARLHER